MFEWFFATLRQYPEISIFLALGLGYYFGGFTFKGIGLGSVTATLLAAVIIGQIGITISPPLKATVFLMFLFAVGYGVGPQFVRGVAKDGLPQAIFSVVQCVFCLAVPVVIAKMAGYDLGYAAGLFAGSQTISASMGLATDAINRVGLPAEQTKGYLDAMPIAYAVSYIFGTVGSAIVIALVGPALLRINLPKACKEYEEKFGGTKEMGGAGSAWHRWVVRAFRVQPGGKAVGLRAAEAEGMIPDARVFVLRLRRNGAIEEASADTVLREGDVVAVAGAREVLVRLVGEGAKEVDDAELLNVPVEGVDVFVTNKTIDGQTLTELAQRPSARGVFLRKITRGATATDIPVLPNTTIHRGDILTLVGRTQDTSAAAKDLGVLDRPTDVADVAFIGGAITIGALVGALVWKVAGIPLTLSTAGGARLVHEFGRPQHLHRGGRHLGRAGLRQRPQDAGHRPVPVGRRGDDDPPDSRDVRRQVHLSVPRRAPARHRFRCAHDHGVARPGLRCRPQPGAGARLHRHLRRRQHAAHDLGHGHHHAAVMMQRAREET